MKLGDFEKNFKKTLQLPQLFGKSNVYNVEPNEVTKIIRCKKIVY
ncbi:hypothetical protein HMPREF9412_1056 [Paenibacillus sp. HGF5]|nr:hypothetical protein HMPREF9412_1056 [Paenibacillus sp. HGF5]